MNHSPHPAPGARRPLLAWLLLGLPVLFNAVFLFPELRIGRYPLNDAVFHQVASERLGQALTSGENPLDAWLGAFSLGYPLWHAYQVLPHFLTGLLFRLTEPWVDHATVFNLVVYLLLVSLPLGYAALARALGMGLLGAGAAATLSILLSAQGNYGVYGAGLGAYVWRGSGLYTQLWGHAVLLWALAAVVVSVRRGKGLVRAGVLLGLASLCHIVAAYVGAVSAVLLALSRLPRGPRSRGVALLRTGTALLAAGSVLAFFVVPMAMDGAFINLSRWEDAWKWDSFGATAVLDTLVHGRLLDQGRAPVLTFLLGGSVLLALFRARRVTVDRAVLLLTLTWLLLFFGRDTWGNLLLLAGLPSSTPLHRLQMAFEIFAVLLMAAGVERALRWRKWRHWPLVSAGLLAALLLPAFQERLDYLARNQEWGEHSLAANQVEGPAVRAILDEVHRLEAQSPGRVHAGKKADWGGRFRVGEVPVYALVARDGLATTSFLYHSMSMASDPMVLMDSTSAADLALFGARYLVAPSTRPLGPGFTLLKQAGRFRLYQVEQSGLFDVITVPWAYQGATATFFETSSAWMKSGLRAAKQHGALFPSRVPEGAFPRVVHRWEALPEPAETPLPGRVLTESRQGEEYAATITAPQPCHVLFKMAFHPGLRATVDGQPAETLMVVPGFTAIPVPAGEHQVRVVYRAGMAKPVLLLGGLAALWGLAWALRRGALRKLEARLLPVFHRWNGRWKALGSDRLVLWLLPLLVVALRPCFRGLLMDGHDATEYPPRLVEFHENIRHGILLPLWAPDLGNGFGQPLFEYVPPLFQWVAQLFVMLGLRLATSIGLAAVVLGLVAALSCYALGRLLGSPRAGLVMAAAYLFSPYLQLDLYVRGNYMEYSGVAVLPLAVVLLLWLGMRPGLGRLVAAAGAVAAVMLSHNVVALLAMPALAVLAVVSHLRQPRVWAWSAAALLLGMALSAFGWLPALVERDLVQVDRLREGALLYVNHFVEFWQLLHSSWGYGQSVPGPGDGMSFALRPAHLVLGALGLGVAWRAGGLTRRVAAAAALLTLGAAFMTTAASRPFWDRLVTLQYLQFSWRFLVLPSLGLSILAGLGVLGVEGRPRARAWVTAAAVLVLAAAGIFSARPSRYLHFDDEFYLPSSIGSRGLATTTREEYEPRTVQRRPPYTPERLDVSGCAGAVDVEQYRRASPERQEWNLRAQERCTLRVNTFFHPGWRAQVDGQEVPVSVEPVTGRMLLEVAPGRHQVTLALGSTPLRQAARTLSALALLLAVLAVARRWAALTWRGGAA